MTMRTPAGQAAFDAARREAERPQREFQERVAAEVARQLAELAAIPDDEHVTSERGHAPQEPQPMKTFDEITSPKSTDKGTRETDAVPGRYSDGAPLPNRTTVVHDVCTSSDKNTPSRPGGK
jgi:hypothetical protein